MYFDKGLSGRALQRRRKRSRDPNRDFFMPSITDGLRFNVPFRFGNEILYSADAQTALSVETISNKGTRQNWKSGLIEQVITDVAKIVPGGVSLSGIRKNFAFRSQELDVAPWVQANIAVTANQIIAPDGTLTGDKLEDDCAGSRVQQAIAGGVLTNNLQYTLSVFVKEGDSPDFSLYLVDAGAAATRSRIDFQWTSGVPSVKSEDIGTGRVSYWGGGWYRAELTCPVNVIVGANLHTIRIYPTEDGAGASGLYMYGWGVDFEEGTFASPYIPTVAASVENPANLIRVDNTAGVHLPAAAGSLIAAITPVGASQTGYVFDLSADGDNEFWLKLNAGKPEFKIERATVTQADLTATDAIAAKTLAVVGMAWAANDVRLYVNGGDEQADVAATMPASVNGDLFLGTDIAEANPTFVEIAQLLGYNRALNAGEFADVTRDIRRMMSV